MGYYLGVDVGSVNAKLALIDEDGSVSQFDTEKITSSPRAAVSSLISRLGENLNLKEIAAAGVSGSPGSCQAQAGDSLPLALRSPSPPVGCEPAVYRARKSQKTGPKKVPSPNMTVTSRQVRRQFCRRSWDKSRRRQRRG